MYGADTFVSTFGSVVPGDDELLAKIVSNAVREGFAIVLDKPGEKVPMCILSAIQAKRADTEAKNQARSIGDPHWHRKRHDCGLHHALTIASTTGTDDQPEGDTKKVAQKVGAIVRRVVKASGGVMPNIGVEVGRSRLIVVDADTADEVNGFRADWEKATGEPAPGMTVLSPGKKDRDGNWVHRNGGHYWFTIPDGVELPAGTGAMRAESGWVVMWSGHQVLVPPSHRAEGAYTIVGDMPEAHPWLLDAIMTDARERMERASNRGMATPDGDIDQWAAGVSWADILEPDGWTDANLPDTCGCPIFTAPGPHGSPKSATAHGIVCSKYDASPGHAPLHIWTDNPPDWLADAVRRLGTKTLTKLTYLAWRDHEGSTKAVLAELGLNTKDAEFPGFNGSATIAEWSPLDEALEKAENPTEGEEDDVFTQPDSPVGDKVSVPEAVKEPTRAEQIIGLMIGSDDLDSIKPAEPLIDGFFDVDSIARVTGKSNHGKSFVMLDMAGCVATGRNFHGFTVKQGLVVYMVAEGASGWKRRVRAWEAKYMDGGRIPKDQLLILPFPIQATSEDWRDFTTALEMLGPVMVVLDTQARVTVGVDENDAKEMGIFVEKMEQVRRRTGACVIAVHHLGHAGEHGRGSTAVIGALGSEVRVVKTKEGFLTVESEKQKDQAQFEPLKFQMEEVVWGDGPRESSVVPVPDGWVPIDPEADPLDAQPQPAPATERFPLAQDKVVAILWTYFYATGATKAEAKKMASGASGDGSAWTEFGRVGESTFMRVWNELWAAQALSQVKVNGKPVQKFKIKKPWATRLGLVEAPAPDMPDGWNVPGSGAA